MHVILQCIFFQHFVSANFMPVHVHGALILGGLSHGSRPLRRSEAWGRDNHNDHL